MSVEPWRYVTGTTGLRHAIHFEFGAGCPGVWAADIDDDAFLTPWNKLPPLTKETPLTCLWCAAAWNG